MTKYRPPRLPRRVLAALEGQKWTLEHRSRHWAIVIDGRIVAVFNSFDMDFGSSQITAASIRRFLRRRQTA